MTPLITGGCWEMESFTQPLSQRPSRKRRKEDEKQPRADTEEPNRNRVQNRRMSPEEPWPRRAADGPDIRCCFRGPEETRSRWRDPEPGGSAGPNRAEPSRPDAQRLSAGLKTAPSLKPEQTPLQRSGSVQLDIPDFSNSVLSHLNQLRVQGRLCDIVVNVQGQSFRAHKLSSQPARHEHRVADGHQEPLCVRAAAELLLHRAPLPAAGRHHQLPDGRQLPADATHY
ncbi:hypothetical protein F7725_027175 [Dissostichus mawsoni]|uniref:Uncharacterized protein n=1 Tax=Dissostichus mawsoni TaxID=36200 RepID=A0A7J5XDF5_DISMA|nr:hypothetical protein F7725_027175 [Dissostichus mawsoni]